MADDSGSFTRAGFFKKKPSSAAGKPWASSSTQKRYFVTRGYRVDYYTKMPSEAGAKSKPKGSFDLRAVTTLRPGTDYDTTAPEFCLELVVDSHHIVVDFGSRDERDGWLAIWSNAVPPSAMPAGWEGVRKHTSADLRSQLEALSLREGAPAKRHTTRLEDEDESIRRSRASTASASASEIVITEGALWKQGHVRHTWKRRHFRLTSWGNLRYYESEAPSRPIDVIALAGCSVFVPKTRRPEYPNAFRLQLDARFGGKRKYILSGESAAESSSWQQAILRFASLPVPPGVGGGLGPFCKRASRANVMGPPSAGFDGSEPDADGVVPGSVVPPDGQQQWGQVPPSASAGKRRVMVLGSTGNVGQATLHWMVQRFSATCEILAGTRDPTRLSGIPGIVPVEAYINDPQESWLSSLDALVVITPGNDQRVPSTIRMAEAAAKAGVKHIVVVSVISADVPDTVFGDQFREIETVVKEVCASSTGSRYTLVRLPLFLENYYGFVGSVKAEGLIRCSMDPKKEYSPIAVSDIGEALAAIGAERTGKYLDRTLCLAGEAHTVEQMATWLSEARGAPVRYELESAAETREALLGFGFIEWQAAGIAELYELVSRGEYAFDVQPLRDVLGHEPMSVREWLRSAAPAFCDTPEAAEAAEAAAAAAEAAEAAAAAELAAAEAAEGGGTGQTKEEETEGDAEEAGGEEYPEALRAAGDGLREQLVAEGRPRQPTLVMSHEMEQVWEEVFLLEAEGKLLEAAEHQAMRMVQVKEKYDSARLALAEYERRMEAVDSPRDDA